MQFLRRFFTPHTSNNYRAKMLHHSTLFSFVVMFLVLSGVTYFVKTQYPSVLGISYSITENELLQDTNKERVNNGLPTLNLSGKLSDAARRKAANMFEKHYWAHFGPNGETPWSFIKAADYNYFYAGENLAKGFTNSQDVVTAWMNSPSHKENLLSPKYKDIGFAVVEGNLVGEDTVLVVQMFGSETEVAAAPQVTPPVQKAEVPVVTQVPIITQVPVPKTQRVAELQGKQAIKAVAQPLISTPTITKSIASGFLILIIGILALDLLIVEKKKVPRLVGHNLDHIIILFLFLLFIILERTGGIL